MTDVARLSKKAFTWSVVSATILWSMGAAALVPLVAEAAECPTVAAGSLIKVPNNSAVYLVNADLKRMYFPTGEVFKTWFKDFSGVQTIANTCIDNYPSAGGINFRPGSRLVKTVVSPNVFAVGPNNMKHKIASEAVAKELYGASWASIVRDLPDVFDSNLSVGAEVAVAKPHNGQLVKKASSADVYSVSGGKLVKVDGTLSVVASGDVRVVSDAVFASVETASGSVTPASLLDNPAQKAAGSGTGTTVPVSGGDLTVSVSANTPAATTLSNSTSYNKLLTLTFKAGSKDVKVTSLTVTRKGFLANTSIAGVSVWDGASNRHGDVMSSFNSDNRVVIGFAANPIVVPANGTETVTVAFSLGSAATSGTVAASIDAAAHIGTTATVAGTFPLSGNTFGLTDGSSSLANVYVTGQAVGGSSAEGTENADIGETKEIAKFKFDQNNGKNDLAIDKLTFYLQGTVKDKDLKNFTVVSPEGKDLGKTEYASDRYVTVKLDTPYVVAKSTNRTLTVKATIADGSGNTFRVHLQNDSDMLIKDNALGYYILPLGASGAAFSDTTPTTGWFKMRAGTVSINKASTSLSGNVSAGATGVVLGKFEVKAVGEDVELRKIGVQISTSSAMYGDAYRELNGNVILRSGSDVLVSIAATTDALYGESDDQYNLSQYLTIKSGETKVIEVVGDISSSATTSAQYTAKIGNMYMKRLSSLDFADNKPTATAAAEANTLTVQTTNLTFTKDTNLGNKNISTLSTVVIGQYIARAGSAEDISVNNLSVSFSGDTTAHMQDLSLWVDGVQLGSTISSVASSSNSFVFTLPIAKDTSKTMVLKAYTPSTASGVIIASSTITYLGKDTNNSASVSNVAGQTMTIASANVIITAASDATTISKVLVGSDTPVQVGKWKVEAQNEDITFDKLTFQLRNSSATGAGSVNTTSSNFGTFYLYDATDMTKVLGEASYVPGTNNGYVQFSKAALVVVKNGESKYLVLKAKINGSGTMTPDLVTAWTVLGGLSTDSTYISASKASGGTLGHAAIDVATSSVNIGDTDVYATSTWYLFHNSVPVITAGDLGSALSVSTQAPVFKFTVKNSGDRELRVGTTTINVSASGLASSGINGTGTVHSFKLWEANESGGLATQLATSTVAYNTNNTACLAGGLETTVAGQGAVCANAATSSLNVVFGIHDDSNSLFDNLTVVAGGSRSFILTADTTSVLVAKSTGSVSVSAKLDGSTGFSAADTTQEDNWANGVLLFYYTPVSGSENTTAYSASDSYDVIGNTLSKSV